jgi:acyl-CoA synthetase (AMP-forming)/AMP-acid ligase II
MTAAEFMNLASWLNRAGLSDPQRPALGIGPRVLRTYGESAGRAARLAGALQRIGLNPSDRVAIAAKNSPDYVEILYAIWHAGSPPCRPTPSCTAPSLATSSSNPARGCALHPTGSTA